MCATATIDDVRSKQLVVNATDPTRTITIRNQFIADMTRRYKNLMAAIRISVVEQDALGLALEQPIASPASLAATPAGPRAFAFTRDPAKVNEFMAWLKVQENNSVLEIIPGPPGVAPGPYSNQYIQSSYTKGLRDNLVKMRRAGIEVPATTLPGAAGVTGLFHQPIHQDTVQMIYTRTFTELEGITQSMNAQISQVLANGLIEGIGPEEMARRINNRVDKVGLSRSKMIARTEVVETYNQAAVMEFRRAEAIIGEQVFVEWQTAEDERVRGSHRNRNGKVFTQKDGLCLIGEPNCRCALLPFLQSFGNSAEVNSAGSFKAGCG